MPQILVHEPCDGTEGQHYCRTHDLFFRHNWDASSHEKDNPGCEFLWICPEHGYERPS